MNDDSFDGIDITLLAPLLNNLVKKEIKSLKLDLEKQKGWTGTVESVNVSSNTATVRLTGDTRGVTSERPNKTNQSLSIGDYVHLSSFTGDLNNSWIDVSFNQYT